VNNVEVAGLDSDGKCEVAEGAIVRIIEMKVKKP
jgi:hypothetical protein